VQREGCVGVEVIPLDQISDRSDEDRLEPPADISERQSIGPGCGLTHSSLGGASPLGLPYTFARVDPLARSFASRTGFKTDSGWPRPPLPALRCRAGSGEVSP